MQAPNSNQNFSRGIAGRRILKALRPMLSETTEIKAADQDNRRPKRALGDGGSLPLSCDIDQPSKRVRQFPHEFPIEQGLASTPTAHNRSSQIGESSPTVNLYPQQLFGQACDVSVNSNRQPQHHAATTQYPPSLQAKINTRNKMVEKMEVCQRRITDLYTVMANSNHASVVDLRGLSDHNQMHHNNHKRRKPLPASGDLQRRVMAQQRDRLVARLQYCQQYIAVLDMEINMELYGKYFHSL